MTIQEYDRIVAQIREHGHQIFRIEFIKRSTGERRVMLCRLGVTKGVKGVQPGRSEQDRACRLITVYEMPGPEGRSGGFKCVPIDGILSVSPPSQRGRRARTS